MPVCMRPSTGNAMASAASVSGLSQGLMRIAARHVPNRAIFSRLYFGALRTHRGCERGPRQVRGLCCCQKGGRLGKEDRIRHAQKKKKPARRMRMCHGRWWEMPRDLTGLITDVQFQQRTAPCRQAKMMFPGRASSVRISQPVRD